MEQDYILLSIYKFVRRIVTKILPIFSFISMYNTCTLFMYLFEALVIHSFYIACWRLEEDVDQSRKKREHEIENEVVLMVNCNPLRGFLG